MENLNYVVTGGCGFIGSHITEELLKIPDSTVTIIDDLSTGCMKNIEHLDQDRIDLVKGDISKLGLAKILENQDYIFHEAAFVSVPESILHPTKTNYINLDGTFKLLKAACNNNAKKVVTASSAAVYGNTDILPNTEDLPLKPASPYAVSKATCELYSYTFEKTYNLPTACLRYFNVFGPRQNIYSQYSAVIPKFVTALLNDQRPIIYGDGLQTRDFIYVKNVAKANLDVAFSDATGVYNIAHGEKTTINHLLELICDIMGYDFNPEYQDMQKGDIKHSVASISKAEKEFGFNIKKDFKNELKETIDYIIKEFEENQQVE